MPKCDMGLFGADVLALAQSIEQLSWASRNARTALWCALTTTLLLQEHQQIQLQKHQKLLQQEQSSAQQQQPTNYPQPA